MKVSLILLAVTAACVAQSPPGWRPSGRVLLLPARIQEEPSTPTPQANSTQSDEKESDRILDSGEYYVLLEDGKLQMVKYTTSALKEQKETQQAQQPQQYRTSPASSSAHQPERNPESAKFQLEYVQFPLPGSDFTQTKLQYTASEAPAKTEQKDAQEPSGYEARVQYRDVKPISAPIYAYNPAPVVRILKK